MGNKGSLIGAGIALLIVVLGASVLFVVMGGMATQTDSGSAMSLIVYYTDGSYDAYRGTGTLDGSALDILAGNKKVAYIQLVVEGTITGPNLDGLTSWSSATDLQLELYPSGSASPEMSATADYTEGGQSWVSGETKILASYTLYATDIEAVVNSYGEGGWYMQANANTQVNINKPSGSFSLAGNAFAGLSIQYVNDAPTVLSVVVGSTPFMVVR